MHETRKRLLEKVHDQNLLDYFYLEKDVPQVISTLENLTFSKDKKAHDIPFNAAVKGYIGAHDSDSHSWIIKPIANEQEALYHRLGQVVYLIDCMLNTLSAPTVVLEIEGKRYRGSKVVPNAINISSYDYMQQEFKKVIVADLINRWLTFDEDRNPNNYMVIQNSRSNPVIVAIDFDKSDLESTTMKIVGTDDKFGWIRHEKNRYLTLYKPENFDGIPITWFEDRLQALMSIDIASFRSMVEHLLRGYCDDPAAKASLVADNIKSRREYIDKYFRTWFKEKDEQAEQDQTDAYAGFGKTFLKMYQDKK